MSRMSACLGAVLTLILLVLPPGMSNALTWWQPTGGLTLHWVLSDPIDVNNPVHVGERSLSGARLPRPNVLDIDGEINPAQTVATLHARGQKAICYIDAGVYETYRHDAARFPKSVIGRRDGNWDGSYWLDIRRLDVLGPIMHDRMQMCLDKGFDMIEPDDVDGWQNTTGFPLTYQDQLKYNRWLAQTAHSMGIAILQKGDIIQTQDLVDYFDATLNEECYRYRECTNPWNPDTDSEQIGLQAYSRQNKQVWIAEYTTRAATRMCADAPRRGWMGARYQLDLSVDGGRTPC